MYDLVKNNYDVEKLVAMKERSFPTEDHWDHHSPNYIHSDKDEHEKHLDVDKYNDIIHNFKRDLKLQKEIIDYMDSMKRPHLK